MISFENIPHVAREVYVRTFMNEISLLFTFSQIDLNAIREDLLSYASLLGLSQIHKEDDGCIILNDNNSRVTFTSSAVLVSLPSKEYSDFCNTSDIWSHLEMMLNHIGVSPIVWSFTKGNRWAFNKAVAPENEQSVFKLVLSENLISSTDENHLFVRESTDKTCVVTCRFGMERTGAKDSLNLKIMIASQSYSLNGLCDRIFAMNELMFDVWSWAVSEDIKNFMRRKQ